MGYNNILTDTLDSSLPLEKYLAPIARHRPIADEYFFQHGGRNTEPTRNIHLYPPVGFLSHEKYLWAIRQTQKTLDMKIFCPIRRIHHYP
jgi:hypothetical protein